MKTEEYARTKVCNGIAGETQLSEMPQLKAVFEESYKQFDEITAFTAGGLTHAESPSVVLQTIIGKHGRSDCFVLSLYSSRTLTISPPPPRLPAGVEERLNACLRSGAIPDADLVDAIAVCKIRCIDVAIQRVHALRQEVRL